MRNDKPIPAPLRPSDKLIRKTFDNYEESRKPDDWMVQGSKMKIDKTLIALILVAATVIALASIGIYNIDKMARMRANAPCSQMENWAARDVPLRCLPK